MSSSIVGNAVKRDGSAKIRSNKGTPVYECQYSFIVRCTAKDEPYISVLATAGLPTVGLTVDSSGYGVCTGKSATRRIDNPLIWDVICDFSSEIDDSSGSQGDPSSDPVEWIPIYETKFERYQEPMWEDAAGTKVVNSLKRLFPVGVTIMKHIPIWEFFQIESAAITDETIIARSDVINSSTFKGRAAKTLLCIVLSSVVGRYYGALRRLTRYQLKYKKTTWSTKLMDQDYIWKKQGSDDLIPIEESSSTLVRLDGNGRPIGGYKDANSDQPAPNTSTSAHYLSFDGYSAVDFSTFLRT